MEDYDESLKMARDTQKPIMLMLYADWCSWCKRMFGTTFEDPWVRYFKDHYIWLKINSDKEKHFFEEFGQRGFPMSVMIGPDGETLKKFSGFKDAQAMRAELLEVLNTVQQTNQIVQPPVALGKR
jgi:thiol:disulfide interchange protein